MQGGRLPIMDTLPYRCSPVTHGSPSRVAARRILTLLPVTVLLAAGCGKPNAVSAIQSPDVEVASVVQKDVPIFNEWVATLDGYVNAQIQAQVTGYVIQQTYKEGSFVRKGQLLFQIDPRPFQAREAEAQLIAANAQIGVARAAYFPEISLNGNGGFESSALTGLFSGPAGAWSFGASLTEPIFTAGRIRSGVRLAEARKETAVLVYQQSTQGAFRSVADALVAYRKTREFHVQQESLFQSAQDAARLSHMRYSGGATGYLEVLTNETNAFSAELGLVQARLNELLALVQLYEALGGGWLQ